MPKSKKSGKKPAVKVADLSAKSDPKGGADIVITKTVDKASPILFQNTATGTHLKNVK